MNPPVDSLSVFVCFPGPFTHDPFTHGPFYSQGPYAHSVLLLYLQKSYPAKIILAKTKI
jgi:hypothetical protein